MKRPLPTVAELAIFAALALACAGAAALSRAHDVAMAVFALPIFVFAAVLGMRRSGQWASIAQLPEVEEAGAVDEPVMQAAISEDEEAAA